MISVTFTAEDLAKAKRYTECDCCLLATALQRMGYTQVSIGGEGVGRAKAPDGQQVYFRPSEDTPFNEDIATTTDEYRADMIGYTVNLRLTRP